MPALLVPRSPGIFSATGLLATDLKREASVTIVRRLDVLDPEEVERTFAELERQGAAELAREGIVGTSVEFQRQVDMRYVGQSFELAIPTPGRFDAASASSLLERFHAEHDRAYGFCAPDEPTECVSVRLTSVGRIAKPPLSPLASGEAAASKDRRPVYFAEEAGYVDCPVYDRYALQAAVRLEGPAIVEEFDSTTVVHPGYTAEVDTYGNLRIGR